MFPSPFLFTLVKNEIQVTTVLTSIRIYNTYNPEILPLEYRSKEQASKPQRSGSSASSLLKLSNRHHQYPLEAVPYLRRL